MLRGSFFGNLAVASLLLVATPVLGEAANGPVSAPTTLVSRTSGASSSATGEPVVSEVITTPFAQSTQKPGGVAPALKFKGPAWLPLGSNLAAALTPEQQSGDCPLGKPDAPRFGGPLPGKGFGLPWGPNPPWWTNPPSLPGFPGLPQPPYGHNPEPGNGTKDCVLVDPSKLPETGQTRKYNFEISYRDIAPDGVKKQGLVINGGFPGPTIEANWGDWIEVTVTNNLQGVDAPEGTTIHWHGLLQRETPFMDGVPSISQCPIAPGDTFTYRFRADQYGSSWYHSHYSAQYSAGVYGAMIIHGPNDTPQCAGYDEDLGPVLVGDWYHPKYFKLVEKVMNSTGGGPPQSNSVLVNGRANYPCQKTTLECTPNAGLSKFKFESGKKYRMRLINPSSEAIQKISIDGHKFKVIAHDFVPLQPYETDLITLNVGQRTDVIVEATGDSKSSYWFRSTLQANGRSCSIIDGINSNATAVIYYQDASPDAVPTSTLGITADRILNCNNDPLESAVPLFPISSDPVGDVFTQTFNIDFFNNGTNQLWAVNNISARVDYNVAQLQESVQGTLDPQPQWNVYTIPQSAGTARLIVYNSFPFATHPMHLHGHDFQILARGTGVWDGTITNPANPTRRDVADLPAALRTGERGYIVIQFELDNPAINIFHCHVAWHVSAGLYTALVEKPEDIRRREIPDSIPQVCANWDAFSKTVVVDQIDSGV